MNDCITPRLSPQEREEREAYFASQKLREQRAEPPELPPSVSLLDLLDQAQAEQRRLTATLAARDERIRELEAEVSAWRSGSDLGHQRIATLERELAEARQRDEDATDLILRQGRELDAMRPKAEAAERRAEALRVIGDVHQIGVLMGEADRAILAACPAEEPRQVVEPAPAPARWRCEGCKRSVPGYRVRGGPPTEHWHWNEGDSMAMYTCGPCVPVTDAQPSGAAP